MSILPSRSSHTVGVMRDGILLFVVFAVLLALWWTTAATVISVLENLQFTASFKERGALNRLSALAADERQRGVIAMFTRYRNTDVAGLNRTMGRTIMTWR